MEDGRIARVTATGGKAADESPLPWLAPGLIDIQVNGYGGQEFSSAELTVDKVRREAISVATGVFAAHMDITAENDGPVTILLDSRRQF